MASDDDAAARRAALLSAIPGVTIDEAAGRVGVGRAAVARARRALGRVALQPSPADLVVAALSRSGAVRSGRIPAELGGIASWVDAVNHDGCTAAEVRGLLGELERRGVLALDWRRRRWRLLGDWPRPG